MSSTVELGLVLVQGLPALRKYTGFPARPTPERRESPAARAPEKVAVQIRGYQTRSMFNRYHIMVEEDLAETGREVVEY
jgi:hypothetical protein